METDDVKTKRTELFLLLISALEVGVLQLTFHVLEIEIHLQVLEKTAVSDLSHERVLDIHICESPRRVLEAHHRHRLEVTQH